MTIYLAPTAKRVGKDILFWNTAMVGKTQLGWNTPLYGDRPLGWDTVRAENTPVILDRSLGWNPPEIGHGPFGLNAPLVGSMPVVGTIALGWNTPLFLNTPMIGNTSVIPLGWYIPFFWNGNTPKNYTFKYDNINPYAASDIAAILKLENTVILSISREVNSEGVFRTVIEVAPTEEYKHRCPKCGRICKHYDNSHTSRGPKEFRSIPLGDEITVLICQPERVECPEHGVITAEYPWAYQNSCFTKAFDQKVTLLALKMSVSDAAKIMNINWQTVKRCINRVVAAEEPNQLGRYVNLDTIGIDENYIGRVMVSLP